MYSMTAGTGRKWVNKKNKSNCSLMAQMLRSVLTVCSSKVNIRVLMYIINTHIQKNKPANGEEKDGTRSMLTGSKLNILESKTQFYSGHLIKVLTFQ